MQTLRRLSTVLVVAGILLTLLPLAPLSANPRAGTVFVRMPAETYDAADLAPLRALDYDTFLWLELAAADFAALQASGLPYYAPADPFTLDLGGLRFDPRQGGPNLPTGWDGVRSDSPDLHLVQFVGPTRAAWLDALRSGGLEVVQYVHPFSYVVWGERDAVDRLAGSDFVHWTGPFAPAYRLLPPYRTLPDRPYRVNVLLYRGADTDAALHNIELLGGELVARTNLNQIFELAGFVLPGTQLPAAAQVPGVYSIQRQKTDGGLRGEMSNQINVNNHDEDNLAFPGYLEWLAGAGVNGAGVIIANVDGGVEDTHPDLVNRIVPCSGQTCGDGASSAHGTHTAGIMAADASSGVKDSYGFYRGLGMAPGANLVEQVYSPWYSQPGGMLLLMSDSYNNGASLSGNSWGPAGTPQGYDDDTMQVDIGVRDADPDAPGNQPLSYILSIMNGNGGYQTQGTPDEAKNIFTIGSTKMQYSSGAQILEINDLSANTAHGPCLDGRLIPHMVAPGCYVDSTVPGGHGLMCGTSMASPHMSGAVALFVEYYRNVVGVDPSPAMVKAAYLPLAHDLAGHLDADGNPLGHPFDYKQGWGRMDTAAVVSPTAAILYYDNPVVFDNTGEEWGKTLIVADPGKPVRLMLVWTDAPGHGLGGSTPAWNNDLDLVVEAGGDTYRGNHFGTDGWSIPGGTADDRNNTEGVFLGPTADGSFDVRVIASNINSDGIPNYGDDTDQDLALVCWNCLEGADYTLHAEPDAFDLCRPEIVTSTIEVGQVLSYTEPVALVVRGVPTGTTAEITPTVVTPPGQALLTLDVGETTDAGAYTLVVSGTAEVTRVHTFALDLLVSSELPGTPTLLTPTNGAMDLPYESLTFGWEPLPQAHNYSLQVDTHPLFATPLLSVTGIPIPAYELDTGLEPSGCYFWRAKGANACGEGGWADPFHFATVRLDQAFWDDFEGGGGNWTATGLWHVSSAPTDTCAQAHSGSSSWYYGQEPQCDYDVGTNEGTLTTADPIDLADALAPATLRFWSWEQTENSAGYDTRKVYLSPNGTTWNEVWDSTDDGADWYPVEIDVSSYAGGDLYVRFEFDSGDSLYNNYRGWYVDDVEVIAAMPPADPMDLTAIDPDQGTPYEETPVTITGAGFVPTPVAQLDGTLLLSVTCVNSTTVTAVVPAGMAPGTYDLTLINGDCQDDTLPDAFTVVGLCTPPSGTLESDSPVELGEPVHLTATITGTTPFSYTWDFGGPGQGSGLDGPYPVYTYTDPGTFTATLTVENACGSALLSATVEVRCTPPSGTWESDSPVELGEPVHLTATVLSGTAPFSYTWDFGGPGQGSGLDGPYPVYTYTDPGTFTVALTVENACGSALLSATVEVRCTPPAGTWESDSPVELGEPVHLTATVLSGTEPLSYTWDFGGPGQGSGLDGPYPVYTYTDPGTFTATLTVENACGSALLSATVEVRCTPPAGTWESDGPVELGEPVHLTATITGTEPLSYTWDFGGPGQGSGLESLHPVYTYTDPGTFTVILTLDNPCGPTAVSGTVDVLCHGPSGGFTTNSPVILGEAMAFTATVTGTAPLTYSWDLGDGVGWSDQPTLAYTYTTSGTFLVTLTVGGPCGTAAFTDIVTVRAALYEIYLPLVLRTSP